MEDEAQEEQNFKMRGFFRRISDSGLPVYSLTTKPCPDEYLLSDRINPALPRAVVITIPRSGTHLTSKLLEGMGMIYGGLHLAPSLELDVVEDRRGRIMHPDGRLTYKRHRLPLSDVFRMVGPGQFVQGHVPYDKSIVAALTDCKIVYVTRDLRSVAVSAMRFIAHLSSVGHVFDEHWDTRWIHLVDGPLKMYGYLQSFGTGLIDVKNAIEPWQRERNAFVLDFDRLTGADQARAVQCLASLAEFIGASLDPDTLRRLLDRVVGAATLTWTGRLSRWQDLWSDEVETAFQRNVLRTASGDRFFSEKMESLLSAHHSVEPRKAKSAVSWLDQDGLQTKLLDADVGADLEHFKAHVLSERISAARGPSPITLQPDRGACLLEGCTLEQNGGWFSLSSLEGHVGHKHLGMPIPGAEPCTIVTFSLLVKTSCSNRYVLLQAGYEEGVFHTFFDLQLLKVVQMQHSGGCRSLISRMDRHDDASVRLSLCGMMGLGIAPFVRVYLSDGQKNLDFLGQSGVQVKDLAVAYGMEVFAPTN